MGAADKRLKATDLSRDQAEVFDAIVAWTQAPKTLFAGSEILTVGGYAGCLAGDTKVIYTRGKRVARRTITLRDLYLKFNGKHGSGRGAAQRWAKGTTTFLESYFPDGRIARNRVLAVFDSGVKPTIRLTFSDGSRLIVTEDHPIAIPSGEFVEAGELRKGSRVLARGSMKMAPGKGRDLKKRPPRVVVTCKYHPLGGRKPIVCNGKTYLYARVSRARLVVEAALNNLSYEEFVLILKKRPKQARSLNYLPASVDVHHKDEDTLNDVLSNLEVIPAREHARIHGRADGWKHFNREYTRELTVTSKQFEGYNQTYDVQMKAPANNFVANGVVVHNTGKTSILGVFAATTKLLVAYVTFTGRASSVLQRKLAASRVKTTTMTRAPNEDHFDARYQDPNLSATGGPAFVGTLHRLLYIPVIDPRTEELKGWRKRDTLDRQYDLIVVDEASMVGDSMLEDLRRHGVPILAVGDHGQLPPVMDSGELMQNPDLRLEKIHRQARDNPIIALSKSIRLSGLIRDKHVDGKRVVRAKKTDIEKVLKHAYKKHKPLDVGLLCWMNKTRIRLNGSARSVLKHKGVPKAGELVLALKNAPPIYNGMRGVLTAPGQAFEWTLITEVEFPEEGLAPSTIEMCGAQFNRERAFQSIEEMQARGLDVNTFSEAGALYDFGYAMTVHKSQGSSFKHVVFYVDRPVLPHDEDWRRFAYTAVTRASETLTVVS